MHVVTAMGFGAYIAIPLTVMSFAVRHDGASFVSLLSGPVGVLYTAWVVLGLSVLANRYGGPLVDTVKSLLQKRG
jgi:hypothetical protein